MHMPKPITIQGCNVGCLDKPVVNPSTLSTAVTHSVPANHTEEPLPSSTVSLKEAPRHRIGYVHPTAAINVPLVTPTAWAPITS